MSYDMYERALTCLVRDVWRDPENLEIGENISDLPEVKIIFDGYGDLDDDEGYVECGDTNLESYAIFIHRDALTENFEFPEHDTSPWCLIHRPEEEVCIYAWYEVDIDNWTFNSLEETSDHTMTNEEVMNILNGLYKKHFEQGDNND